MSSLFVLIFLIALALLTWGLINPRYFSRFTKSHTFSRGRAGLTFGMLALASFIIVGITAPKTAPQAKKVEFTQAVTTQAATTPKVQAATTSVKTITETKPVAFTAQSQNDATLTKGQTKITQAGKDGIETDTYSVTYTNGLETKRVLVSQAVTTQPIPQVTATGTYVAPAPKAAPSVSCSGGYINVDGNCIPSPSNNPTGATAQCNDGTYSYSQHHSGTCSGHGGVARWL